MSATFSVKNIFAQTWQRYLVALRERPLRTKMITSGAMYVGGDCVAQFGIEGRRIDRDAPAKEQWDPVRTIRLTFYGGVIFAPLAHHWIGAVDRIRLSSRVGTLLTRLATDMLIWSPFVCTLFPSSLGFLEGKNLEEVKQKVQMSWFPTYTKALSVFGPTQVINYAFVPVQHRLLLLQGVGLCWNIFLSWQNNLTNHRMAEAALHLAMASTVEEKEEAREEMREAEKKREEIRGAEGGGEVGVATRLSWS
ncbi:hypothetical protein BCR39DRAFT_555931 [Naematelia encephala]|uniref:Uncharacterized protein n=1 Tax=Naematelia encephala TaxID=71784 RepID=A0A1Y2BMH5_9TREE|nr:hypothetical protein BCR39DRAFT_555931 [Naematelia encephala]